MPQVPPSKAQAQHAEDRDLEKTEGDKGTGDKPESAAAIHDPSGQRRDVDRLSAETKAAQKTGAETVVLRTATGAELIVTKDRWQAEAQTLRQQGYDPVDQIPQQQ
jgi:hypothetical protein